MNCRTRLGTRGHHLRSLGHPNRTEPALRTGHVGPSCSTRGVTLKAHVEDPRSPLRQFLDAQMPNTKAVRKEWRQAATTGIDIQPPSTLGPLAGAPRRYPSDTVGHAASLRVTGMFSTELPQATVPRNHPLVGRPWLAADAARAELKRRITTCTGFDPLPDDQERLLLRLCFVAGVVDQVYRTPPVYRSEIPLLDVPADASLDELLAKVPEPCIDDLFAVITASRPALRSLAAAGGAAVVVAPTFLGSPDVGAAEGDLIVGQTLVELKTRGKNELQQRHLHQLVGYALLDYVNRYGINELAIVSLRHASVVRWPLQQVIAWMTGADVSVSSLRAALRGHLATADWS